MRRRTVLMSRPLAMRVVLVGPTALGSWGSETGRQAPWRPQMETFALQSPMKQSCFGHRRSEGVLRTQEP